MFKIPKVYVNFLTVPFVHSSKSSLVVLETRNINVELK